MQRHWHLFCRVIDNFGDIGVCWRLAKQLHQQHQQRVTLWVDDLVSFQALCPDADTHQAVQTLLGIQVHHWREPFIGAEYLHEADVIIEAFACDLPNPVLEVMQSKKPNPLWLNLEYLSAEDWVDGFHGSQSPVANMQKVFFFPGFSDKTGGLLWEPDLLTLAHHYQAEKQRSALFERIGIAPKYAHYPLTISLFAYENPQLQALLHALAHHSEPVHLLVPQGRISHEVQEWLGQSLEPGQTVERGAVAISALPFLAQPDYDCLLACCQLNFVRGEESFVRAQMLGLPMVWHIYQQEEDAHLIKLNAFLARYTAAMPKEFGALIASAMRAWNQPLLPSPHWNALLSALPAWQQEAKKWQKTQANHGDLASNLVHYAINAV